MGKGRFTALDTRAMAAEVRQKLVGCRISNIYDINSRTYLFKFSGKDVRSYLLIESGIRFHLTSYSRELPSMPNAFCSKLRKHLRTKRFELIEQMGKDRIIRIQFGNNPQFTYHLIIELYSGGNIILVNNNYLILACLRVVIPAAALQQLQQEKEKNEKNNENKESTKTAQCKDEEKEKTEKTENTQIRNNKKMISQIVRPKETYTFDNITQDTQFDMNEIENKLRFEIGKLIKNNLENDKNDNNNKNNNKNKNGKNSKNKKTNKNNKKEAPISKRKLRRMMKNKALETIGEFIVSYMGTSPIIAESCMYKYNIDKNESLLNYVDKPLPHLKIENHKNKNKNDEKNENKMTSDNANGDATDQSANEFSKNKKIKNKGKKGKNNKNNNNKSSNKAAKHSKNDFGDITINHDHNETQNGLMSSSDESESDNDSSSEDDDTNDNTVELEDAMYHGLTNDEKIAKMILNNEKFEIIKNCFMEYDELLINMKNNIVKGYIISKLEKIIPMKEITLFSKPQRKKLVAPSIEIDHESKKIIEKPAEQVRQTAGKQEQQNDSTVTTNGDNHNQNENENENEIENNEEEKEDTQYMYEEFLPIELYNARIMEKESHNELKIEEFNTFNTCVDAFYTSMESMKSEMKQTRNEQFAWKKLLKAKTQHEERIITLENEANKNGFLAWVIEENLENVDRAIDGVNILLSQGESWHDLSNRIREDAMYGNPIAKLIVALKLHENIITLKLPHNVEIINENKNNENENDNNDNENENENKRNKDGNESDSDLSDMFDDNDNDENNENESDNENENIIETRTDFYKIDIDLSQSAWNNAKRYYSMKKSLLDKKDKTLDATKHAIKAAEIKTREALEEAKLVSTIVSMRKTYWFEKFYWFITSDNYLVIGGRDAQQNELIVKKYMSKTQDIYVHAHIHGASSVIIKNPNGKYVDNSLVKELKLKYGNKYDITKDRNYFNIPERTINEACCMCVCRSVAWKNNVTTQGYWVFGYQVSKSAPSGEYLPTGSFVIRGKKNFIMPQPLVMGCAIMFKIDEKSWKKNHSKERMVKYFDKRNENENENDDSDNENENDNDETQTIENSSDNEDNNDNNNNDNDNNENNDVNNEESTEIMESQKPQQNVSNGNADNGNDTNTNTNNKEDKIDTRLKKTDDENSVYITRTMVQVTAKDLAKKKALKLAKEKQLKQKESEKNVKKVKKKMNKKLAKYGMIGKQAQMDDNNESKNNNDESNDISEASGKGGNNNKNSKNNNNNKNQNFKRKRKRGGGGGYRSKYGDEDQVYLKQLLGIKEEKKKDENNENEKGKEKEKKENDNNNNDNDDANTKIEHPKQGYELTEKTDKEKERLRQFALAAENEENKSERRNKSKNKEEEKKNGNENENENKNEDNENSNDENNDNENENDENEDDMDEFELQRQHKIEHSLQNEIRLLTGNPIIDDNDNDNDNDSNDNESNNNNEKDTILFAMAMCAPWSTLTKSGDIYQFKVKIQPGKQKRGSAVKHVTKIFEHMCDNSYYDSNIRNQNNKNKNKKYGNNKKNKNKKRSKNSNNNNKDWEELEKEKRETVEQSKKENENVLTQYVKSIKDTEISSVFLSDVKISAQGLREIEENERKKKQNIQKQQWQENVLNQKKAEIENKDLKDKLKAVQPKKRKKVKK